MITVENTLTGGQIGRALVGDLEEFAYCLSELSVELQVRDFGEVADHVQNPEIVGPFLRALADQIDPQKETSND